VQVLRNGLRSVAYGRGQTGALDLRFMPANADIQKGDVLVTSGIDGVYPPGLSVASVALVETRSADSFARIVCRPLAGIDRHRQLLILLVEPNLPPRPEPDVIDEKSAKLFKRRLRDSTRDNSAEDANATPKDKPAEDRKGAANVTPPAKPAAAAAPATPAAAAATAKPAAKESAR
jgi:rod shape-determining protein MreC